MAKLFYAKSGRIMAYTLTVRELIGELNKFDPELPVFARWEGVNAFIQDNRKSGDYIFLDKIPKQGEIVESVIIDVNEY